MSKQDSTDWRCPAFDAFWEEMDKKDEPQGDGEMTEQERRENPGRANDEDAARARTAAGTGSAWDHMTAAAADAREAAESDED